MEKKKRDWDDSENEMSSQSKMTCCQTEEPEFNPTYNPYNTFKVGIPLQRKSAAQYKLANIPT